MSNKLKILYFITQSELGGAQKYVYDLVINLKGEFELFVALGEQGGDGELASKLTGAGINYYTIPHLKRAISPYDELIALTEIIKLIIKLKPDIIHLNSSKISILGSIAGYFAGMQIGRQPKIIYTVHGWVFNEPLPKWQKLLYRWAEKFTATFKDKIICVSRMDYEIAIKEKVAPAKKLIMIHNGIEPIKFLSKDLARQTLFKKVSAKGGPASGGDNLVVGTIGNLYKTKGYEYFIQAANILIADHRLSRFARSGEARPITFFIIGEGDQRKMLEKLIEIYQLKDNFILTGMVKDAAQLLSAFDIFVCSSVKEGFPYNILEAMSAGLPIVSTNVGGIPEMITDKKTGLLVEPAKFAELAEKIKRLVNDRSLGRQLGRQARLDVIEKFNLTSMIKETKKLYFDLLN